MMQGLEVPSVLPRLNLDSNDRVAEQVRAFSISAICATDRRSQRQIQKFTLLVEREIKRPRVHAETPLPTVTFPGVVTDASRLWHRTEFPKLRAGSRVVSAWIADSADSSLRRVGTDDD